MTHQCSSVWRITGDTLASSQRLLALRVKQSKRHLQCECKNMSPHTGRQQQPYRSSSSSSSRHSRHNLVAQSAHPAALVSHHALPAADLARIVRAAPACSSRDVEQEVNRKQGICACRASFKVARRAVSSSNRAATAASSSSGRWLEHSRSDRLPGPAVYPPPWKKRQYLQPRKRQPKKRGDQVCVQAHMHMQGNPWGIQEQLQPAHIRPAPLSSCRGAPAPAQ